MWYIFGILAVLAVVIALVFWSKCFAAKIYLSACGKVVYSDENGSLIYEFTDDSEFCFVRNKIEEDKRVFVFNREEVINGLKCKNFYLRLHPDKTNKLIHINHYYDEFILSASENSLPLTLKDRYRDVWLAFDPNGNLVFLSNAPEGLKAGQVVKAQKLAFPKQIPVSELL